GAGRACGPTGGVLLADVRGFVGDLGGEPVALLRNAVQLLADRRRLNGLLTQRSELTPRRLQAGGFVSRRGEFVGRRVRRRRPVAGRRGGDSTSKRLRQFAELAPAITAQAG